MTFAERLKAVRKQQGYTQVSLSEALGVTKGAVAMWETGKRTPDYEMLHTMSERFDRRIDYIIGYSDDDSSPSGYKLLIERAQTDVKGLINRYLELDEQGRKAVDDVIENEIQRLNNTQI